MADYKKIYVGMILHIDPDGTMKPVAIEWVNGEEFPITKIIAAEPAPPRHVGSMPTIRYTVRVQGRTRELYYEKHFKRWFLERQI